MKSFMTVALIFFALNVFAQDVTQTNVQTQMDNSHNIIVMQTNKGDIVIELDELRAPKTVANFKKYIKTGFYNNVVFHRVISDFMIQGGGFTHKMEKKTATFTVENESIGGLSNIRGSISMARTSAPHSASSQFFINVKDNPSLDSKNDKNFGYAVFGQVIEGMDVVDSIKSVKTQRFKPPYSGAITHNNSPVKPVIIESIYFKNETIETPKQTMQNKLTSSVKTKIENEAGFVTLLFSLIAFTLAYIKRVLCKCPKRCRK
ncbi:peptidylprolyl isomerase [Marinicellulosiphila megalodicopiae]|uniref:peptidylprolyl isomerase n=1 Tax=Marinicellulosiphila megalodicopiae TaxID=2724896 RepID=UPI003BB0D592